MGQEGVPLPRAAPRGCLVRKAWGRGGHGFCSSICRALGAKTIKRGGLELGVSAPHPGSSSVSPLPAGTNQGVPYNVVIFRNRISRVLPMGVQVPVSARVRVAVQVAAPP